MNRRELLAGGAAAAAGLVLPRRRRKEQAMGSVTPYFFTMQNLNTSGSPGGVFLIEFDPRSILVLNLASFMTDRGINSNPVAPPATLMATFGQASDAAALGNSITGQAGARLYAQEAWDVLPATGLSTPYLNPPGQPGVQFNPGLRVQGPDQPFWCTLEIIGAGTGNDWKGVLATFHGWVIDSGVVNIPQPALNVSL